MHSLKQLTGMILIFLAMAGSALAVNPDEVLSDPALENRARTLSAQIRCLVCQNQSIDDSDAQLARDLRVLVREQLVEGKSDEQILEFLVKRYGEFVLLKPRFGTHTLALWGLPLIALLIGLFVMWRLFSRRKGVVPTSGETLSTEEAQALEDILRKEE